jgi:hypothetical protein
MNIKRKSYEETMETVMIERKSHEQILDVIIEKMFYDDFKAGKCCASDQVRYYDEESAKEYFFNEWLVRKNFATEIK